MSVLMHGPGPTSPDLHGGVWAGVEAGEDGEVRVLVQGGHHHPEHEDQQTRAPLHIAHPSHTRMLRQETLDAKCWETYVENVFKWYGYDT